MVYRAAPFLMTLNNPNPVFKVTLLPWDTDFTVQSGNEAYKICKNYPKIHGQTEGGGAVAQSPLPLNTPLYISLFYRHPTFLLCTVLHCHILVIFCFRLTWQLFDFGILDGRAACRSNSSDAFRLETDDSERLSRVTVKLHKLAGW